MTSNDETHGLPSPSDVVFADIEADGLHPTRIHCLVVKYRGKREVIYDAGSFHKYMLRVDGAPFCFHNGLGYDCPVLRRLWGVKVHNCIDTLVLSSLANPSRSGGHSLRAWGNRLGFPKGDYKGSWEHYNWPMLRYCVRDVDVTERLYEALREELQGFSAESIELEHDVARIIQKQVNHGWYFRLQDAHQLHAKLKEKQYELEDKVREHFKPLPTFVKEVVPKYKKTDGELSAVGLKFLGDNWTQVAGEFSRIDFQPFNLGSRQQIGRYLQHFGWEPKVFTETGQPQVDETILSSVTDIPEAQMIAEYLMVQKRVAQIHSWIEAIGDDQRIHGRVRSNGAITGRMTHDSPNVAQVPSSNAPYGEECRSLWTVPEGFSLVGCDASGLELRMLAHYMNDEEYTNVLLTGDIHSVNQAASGLSTRDQAKTFIYAFLYGAGDAKIGSIVGGNRRTGKELKERFLRNTPSLKDLRERVERSADRGYLKGLDGRKLHVRSSHAALNTLLQGAGAIVMKRGLQILDSYVPKWKIQMNFVGNIHDEWQMEVRQGQEDKLGHLAVASIQAAGQSFNLRCPLDGEYKVGKTWASTH